MEASMVSGLGSLCCTIQVFFFLSGRMKVFLQSWVNATSLQHQVSFSLGISINSTVYCLYTCFPHNMLTQANKQDKALAPFAERFENGLGQLPWLNVICCLYLCAQQGSLLKPSIICMCSGLSIRSLNGSLKWTRRKMKWSCTTVFQHWDN